MMVSKDIQQKLVCPSTNGKPQENGKYLEGVIDPGIRYPVIDGVPILINNEKSLFLIGDFVDNRNTTFDCVIIQAIL